MRRLCRASSDDLTLMQGYRETARCVFAGLYRGPAGVVTIDSWSQLFRRLKKERLESSGWKDILSRHIFLFVRGAGHQPPNNIGSFYVFPYKEAGCRSSLRALSFFPQYVTFVEFREILRR